MRNRLLAIADQMRRAMPRVIGDYPLLQAWGFKYDQRLQGINTYVDFAKVNVNFWVTPKDACEDPGTGGMVIYDRPGIPERDRRRLQQQPGQTARFSARAQRAVTPGALSGESLRAV